MARQQSLVFALDLRQDIYEYGERATGQTHGVVLTKIHIVKLILDLANYSGNLTKLRLLEPSCGEGVFLIKAFSAGGLRTSSCCLINFGRAPTCNR